MVFLWSLPLQQKKVKNVASPTVGNGMVCAKIYILNLVSSLNKDGSMKNLQICMFDSDFYLQQVRILHLDVKVENVQLWISTS